jgi:hypothetical protein
MDSLAAVRATPSCVAKKRRPNYDEDSNFKVSNSGTRRRSQPNSEVPFIDITNPSDHPTDGQAGPELE